MNQKQQRMEMALNHYQHCHMLFMTDHGNHMNDNGSPHGSMSTGIENDLVERELALNHFKYCNRKQWDIMSITLFVTRLIMA